MRLWVGEWRSGIGIHGNGHCPILAQVRVAVEIFCRCSIHLVQIVNDPFGSFSTAFTHPDAENYHRNKSDEDWHTYSDSNANLVLLNRR